MSISVRIKEVRQKEGLTGKAFSSILDIDTSQYSKIEQGKLSLTLPQIMEISSKFNISVDWLLTGEGVMYKTSDKTTVIQGDRNITNTGHIGGVTNTGYVKGGINSNVVKEAKQDYSSNYPWCI